jgi:hypothetical protein
MPNRIQRCGMIITVVTNCQTPGFCPVIRVFTLQHKSTAYRRNQQPEEHGGAKAHDDG